MWNDTETFLCNWSSTAPGRLDCSDELLARATDGARAGPAAGGGETGGIYDVIDTQLLRHVTGAFYCVTFVFGLLGNTLTIIGIAINTRMRTVANCFMLNLALADDLFMISLPFMAYSTVARDWPFGSVACKVLSVMHGVNCYASIFTMTAMSVDRYLAVVHPLSSICYRKPRNAVYVCLVLWLACSVIMTPYWLYAGTGPSSSSPSHSQSNGTSRCQLFWPNKSHFQHQWFWVNFELVVGFALPIVVMVFCYSKLLYRLIRGSDPSGPSLPDRARKPIRKVTAMVFTVTIVFIVCWTPYHLIRYFNAQKQWNYLMTGSRPPTTEVVKFIVFNTVAQALVFVSSCCNPFIYCISSRNFRRVYAMVVCRCFIKTERFNRYLQSTASGTGICLMARNGLRGIQYDINRTTRLRSIPDICRKGDDVHALNPRITCPPRNWKPIRCTSLITRSTHLPIYNGNCQSVL